MEMAESSISSPSDAESPNDSLSDLDDKQTPQKKSIKILSPMGFRSVVLDIIAFRQKNVCRKPQQKLYEIVEMDITTDERGIGNIIPVAIAENENPITDESEPLHLAIHNPSSSHSLSVSPMSNSDALTTSIITSYSSSSNTDVENSEPDSHSSDDISDSESDASLSSENELDEDLAKPLYDGCRLSKIAVYSIIMLYVTKQSLSKDGFEELLQIISVISLNR